MITRDDVLVDAINKCMRELYSLAQPSINYDNFIEENKAYLEKEKEYYSLPEDDRPSHYEYMGPKPYEFYYLPKEIMKDICDSYIHAYKMDNQQELLDTIEILKNYCKNPIVDKYIKEEGEPGYRGYEHLDNLEKEIFKIIDDNIPLYQPPIKLISELQNKFFEFLDMAGKFYNWNGDLNTFSASVYLGASPCSNKNTVIENWKKYRGVDIKIDEEQIKEEYYGEEN